MVDFNKALNELRAKKQGGKMAQGTAKQIITLWETKRDDMMTGDMDTSLLADLVKAAQVGGKTKVKFLAFKSFSKSNKKVLNILAEPSDPYVKGEGTGAKKEERKTSW